MPSRESTTFLVDIFSWFRLLSVACAHMSATSMIYVPLILLCFFFQFANSCSKRLHVRWFFFFIGCCWSCGYFEILLFLGLLFHLVPLSTTGSGSVILPIDLIPADKYPLLFFFLHPLLEAELKYLRLSASQSLEFHPKRSSLSPLLLTPTLLCSIDLNAIREILQLVAIVSEFQKIDSNITFLLLTKWWCRNLLDFPP